jgi:ubiquinone/menaquinone biosynthesis C-methylase UbiE
VWERAAPHYDRQLSLERSAVSAALELLAARPDERLLDVGTGTGEVLRQLTRSDDGPRRATGVDTSPAMLARVPRLPPGWSVRLGDARQLPFADGGFDVAIASYVLHVLPPADLPVALAELDRVLRPGGRLVTITPAIPDRGIARMLARGCDALARRNPERYGGLRALDPRVPLLQAGFVLRLARLSLRGYPSLLVLAESRPT